MKSLYDTLIEYQQENYYPMHMPGHKRNTSLLSMDNPYGIDITEIEGFDNLHDAKGILKDAMERAAAVYQSSQTHFLVNGSTVGLLTGIAACTQKGDRILVARNCHKAVYNGIFLNQLRPVYLYPQHEPLFGINGGISAEDVKEMLIKYPDIKLVVITSPTYEGIVSDIHKIGNVVHKHGIPLLVDEAHGAHLGFHTFFPENAIKQGADLVIHSVHKTLPSFTQTAFLHVNGNLVSRDKVEEYLTMYQTSSPSYLFLAGLDRCMELIQQKGYQLFQDFTKELTDFYNQMGQLKNLQVMQKSAMIGEANGIYDVDPSKIIISSKHTSRSGMEIYQKLLQKYKIQMEMVSTDYVIGMTSIADTPDGFRRLKEALKQIDQDTLKTNQQYAIYPENILLDMELSPYEAYNREGELVSLRKSVGRISKEYAYLYPPGIPLLVPGERITEECLNLFKHLQESKLMIKGLNVHDCIQVVKR